MVFRCSLLSVLIDYQHNSTIFFLNTSMVFINAVSKHFFHLSTVLNFFMVPTLLVWAEVPEAILVSAQAASNCSVGRSARLRQPTSTGRMPVAMSSSMGGFLSDDSSLRHCCTAASCTSGLSPPAAFNTSFFKSVAARVLSISSSSVESLIGTLRRFCRVSSRLFFLSSTVTSFLRLRISCKRTIQTMLINNHLAWDPTLDSIEI